MGYRSRMRSRSTFLAFGLVACAGCSHESGGSAPRTPDSPRAASSCTPPGLEAARPVDRFDLPAGCSFTEGGPPTAPRVVPDAASLAAAVSCPQGVEPPGFDAATKDVYVVRYAMSPASTGLAGLDDGAVVTFVTRFRQPCAGDPMPMPMDATMAFSLPKGATRTFREANCTLPLDCR